MSRSIRGPPAPTITGRPSGRGPRGSSRADAARSSCPSTVARPSRSIPTTIRSPSSNRSNLRSQGNPYDTNSGSFQPAPTPRITRPPDTSSSVSAIFASIAGFRYGMASTYVPSRTRGTATASAVRSVQHSHAPPHLPSGSPNPT